MFIKVNNFALTDDEIINNNTKRISISDTGIQIPQEKIYNILNRNQFSEQNKIDISKDNNSLLLESLNTFTCNLNIKYGLILSSDLFATDRKRLDDIFDTYYKDECILAVDMESASIAKVCFDNDVACTIIRSISDVVGMESQINSYWEFAAQAASNAYQLIKENYLK